MVMNMGLSFSLALQLPLQGELIYGSQLSLASFLSFGPHAYFRTRSGQWLCQLQSKEYAVGLEIMNNTGIALLIMSQLWLPWRKQQPMTRWQRRCIIALIASGNASHLVPSSQPYNAASSIIGWLMTLVLSPLIAHISHANHSSCHFIPLWVSESSDREWWSWWANMVKNQPCASHVVQEFV